MAKMRYDFYKQICVLYATFRFYNRENKFDKFEMII